MNRKKKGLIPLLVLSALPAIAQVPPQIGRQIEAFRRQGWTVQRATIQLINYAAVSGGSSADPCNCPDPQTGGPGLHQNLPLDVTFTPPRGGRPHRLFIPFGYGGNVAYARLQSGRGYAIERQQTLTEAACWQTYDQLAAFQRDLYGLIDRGSVCYNAFGDNFVGRFSQNLGSCVRGQFDFNTPTFNCRDVAQFMWAQYVTCPQNPPP